MKTYFFTNIAPYYRTALWRALLSSPEFEAHFFFGRNPASGIRTIDTARQPFRSEHRHLHRLANIYLGPRLTWQSGVLNRCLADRFDLAVFLGEMSCLSTWVAALICRLRRKKTVFWGHGLYGREKGLTLLARRLFLRLADRHLVYGFHGKRQLMKNGFRAADIHIVFNSLDYDAQKALRGLFSTLKKEESLPFFRNPSLPLAIFVGRLTAIKKIDLLLEAARKINRAGTRLNILIIGDGPQRDHLSARGAPGLAAGWLHFAGEIYDEKENARLLSLADLCVSPGNAGLNVIHSLSFGTPVTTHGNMTNQMPEAEAIQPGETGFYFREGDAADLAEKIEDWATGGKNRAEVREKCYEIIDRYYNPYYQSRVFHRLARNMPPEP